MLIGTVRQSNCVVQNKFKPKKFFAVQFYFLNAYKLQCWEYRNLKKEKRKFVQKIFWERCGVKNKQQKISLSKSYLQ